MTAAAGVWTSELVSEIRTWHAEAVVVPVVDDHVGAAGHVAADAARRVGDGSTMRNVYQQANELGVGASWLSVVWQCLDRRRYRSLALLLGLFNIARRVRRRHRI